MTEINTFAVHRLLVCELLEDLGSSGKSITGLTHTAVDDELVNLQRTHRVLQLRFFVCHGEQTGPANNLCVISQPQGSRPESVYGRWV